MRLGPQPEKGDVGDALDQLVLVQGSRERLDLEAGRSQDGLGLGVDLLEQEDTNGRGGHAWILGETCGAPGHVRVAGGA